MKKIDKIIVEKIPDTTSDLSYLVGKSMRKSTIQKECSECKSTKGFRNLECDEHGKECPLVICINCGATKQ